jgi:hypothetical protein
MNEAPKLGGRWRKPGYPDDYREIPRDNGFVGLIRIAPPGESPPRGGSVLVVPREQLHKEWVQVLEPHPPKESA